VVVASLDDLGRDGVSVAIARIGTVNRVAPHGPRSASLGERAAKGEHGEEARSGDCPGRQLAEGSAGRSLHYRSLLFDSHTESRMDTRFIIRYY
jgi:hypothetical protein